MTNEHIATAAIKLGKLIVSLPRPYRHPDIAIEISHTLCEMSGYEASNQGFLTSEGRFVDRHEAMQIAQDAGQILGGASASLKGLYTEDLW